MTKKTISQMLFETEAIKAAPHDKPFWYTSGTLGPFYINTHYLFGSEETAKEFLDKIDTLKSIGKEGVEEISKISLDKYSEGGVYKDVIDFSVEYIIENIGVDNFDYISGGERRDWFFSFAIANILNKPHITMYKDKSIYPDNIEMKNKTLLHIADLVTKASSYERAWIPSAKERGGNVKYAFSIVDRCQGGKALLKELGTELFSLCKIEKEMFDLSLKDGIINKEQYKMILEFMKSPETFMKEFINNNPQFISNCVSAGGKEKERAELFLENLKHR